MRATIDRWTAPALSLAIVAAVLRSRPMSGDWAFFVDRAHELLGPSGLHVYARFTDIQSGPLALLAVLGADPLGLAGLTLAVAVTGVVTVCCVSRMRPEDAGVRTLLGGLVLAAWWPLLRENGHLDDALVIMLAVAAVLLVRLDRRLAAAVLVGLALAVKPWIVFMLPITLPPGDLRSRRALMPFVSVAVGGLCWAPFLLADHRSLAGLAPNVVVRADSVLALLGVTSAAVGPLLRVVQLLGALTVTTVGVRRGRTGAVLLAGVAVRLLVEPATWSYYTVGLVAGAVVWDVVESRGDVPWATIAVSLLVLPHGTVTPPALAGLLRLTACLGVLALVAWPDREPRPEGAEPAHYGRRRWNSRRSTPLATPSASTSSSTA